MDLQLQVTLLAIRIWHGTTSTTRPIGTLDFPVVTVCPPWGSNTAFNYDLIKADNQSLTEQNRENLKQEAYDIFLQSSHVTYVSSLINITNKENVKLLYNGFQSVPQVVDHNPMV